MHHVSIKSKFKCTRHSQYDFFFALERDDTTHLFLTLKLTIIIYKIEKQGIIHYKRTMMC